MKLFLEKVAKLIPPCRGAARLSLLVEFSKNPLCLRHEDPYLVKIDFDVEGLEIDRTRLPDGLVQAGITTFLPIIVV